MMKKGDLDADEPPITSGFGVGVVTGQPPLEDRLSPLMAHKARAASELVARLLGPEGALGDGETWRCGLMADELVRILAHGGIRATVTGGQCNGYDHVWVVCGGEVLDPARGQFSPPYNYSADHGVNMMSNQLFGASSEVTLSRAALDTLMMAAKTAVNIRDKNDLFFKETMNAVEAAERAIEEQRP